MVSILARNSRLVHFDPRTVNTLLKSPLNRNSRGNNSSPMGSGIAHVFLHASKALVSGHVYLLQALNTLNTFFDLGFDLKSAGEEFENVWRKAATSAASGD